MRRYPTTTVTNMRDLGGYPTQDGRMTRYHRFIRSDQPAGLTGTELAMLRQAGLTTAIDLRGPGEAAATPSCLDEVEGVESLRIGFDPNDFWPEDDEGVDVLYQGLVDGNPALPEVFRTIAQAPGAVLFHCAAGKDRTGVVAAILLMLAGVADADIVADYQVSATYLAAQLAAMRDIYPDMTAFMGQSKPEYMVRFLDWFHAKYGTAEACLLQAGVTGEEIEAIKAKLLND